MDKYSHAQIRPNVSGGQRLPKMFLFFFVVGYVLFCFAFALSPQIQMKHNAFRHAINFSELNLVKLLCNGLEIYQAEMPSLEV